MQQNSEIAKIVQPAITQLGYEYVGLEYFGSKHGAKIEIYIDSEFGVSIEDCQKVSYQVNQILSVKLPGRDYTLVVSSPGIERRLYNIEQCSRQIGKIIKISLMQPLLEQRNFKGLLADVQEQQLHLQLEDGQQKIFNFADLNRAQVVAQW